MNTFLIIIWHVRLFRVKYVRFFLSKYSLICFSVHQQSNWMHFSTSTGPSFMQESGLSAFHHLNAQISHRSTIPTECKSIFSVSVMSVSLYVCDGRWRRSLQTNRFCIEFCQSDALGYSLLLVQAEHYILQAISICKRPSAEWTHLTHGWR